MKNGLAPVRDYVLELQSRICAALEEEDGSARFLEDERTGSGGAFSRPRVLSEGRVIERAAVNVSYSLGDALPPSASTERPEAAGKPFAAAAISLIVHPRNPYAPTTHCNLRAFLAGRDDPDPVWWFGGGFDLTPYYGFTEDALHWHRTAKAACDPFGKDVYGRYKAWCDEYFYLPHRREARGIGGLFYDDLAEGGFDRCFEFTRAVGDAFLDAYRPILARRKDTPYGERERSFQLYRRGRYVEFNLLYDRGTRYGLQSGRRIEAVLASMPPSVRFEYDWKPEPGSEEERLLREFLPPRDWLEDA